LERILIVHHDPRSPRAAEAVISLARAVEKALGIPAAACPVSEPDGCSGPCGLGVALFLARGGHFSDAHAMLRGSCRRVLGPVPRWVTALHVASSIARSGLEGTVYLLYHEAKRLRQWQAEDYSAIAALVEGLLRGVYGLGARVVALGRGEARAMGVRGILLSVMPGGGDRVSLLGGEPGFSLVAGWILGGAGGLFPGLS